MSLPQTFAVPPVEERQVNDGGLLPLSLKHVAVLWPLSLLQDLLIYIWERLLNLSRIVSGNSQGLLIEQRGFRLPVPVRSARLSING